MAFGDYKIGDRGQAISDLQGYLRELGYGVAQDGQFGPETQAAVRAFQSARRIRVDGIAGPETLIEISKARSEGWQAPAMPSVPAQPPQAGAPSASIAPVSPRSSSMNGLVILVAIAIGVWLFTKGRGSSEE